MNTDWILAILCIGTLVVLLALFVVMPMFNAYLEYKMQMKQFETPPVEVHGPMELYEERLQRDHDGSDSPSEIGESDDRPPVHDERL